MSRPAISRPPPAATAVPSGTADPLAAGSGASDEARRPPRSAGPVRPYVLLRGSDLDAVHARLEAITADWSAEWLAEAARAGVDDVEPVTAPEELPNVFGGATELRATRDGAERVAFIGIASPRRLVNELLAIRVDDAPLFLTQLEHGLVEAALDDLGARLTGAAAPTGAAVGRDELQRSAGAGLKAARGWVAASLRLDAVRIRVLLSPEALEISGSRRPESRAAFEPLTPVHDALSDLRDSYLTLPARLAELEMTVAELASLNAGDVIRLDAKAGDPIGVTLDACPYSLHAYVGARAGAAALRVTSVEPDCVIESATRSE